MFKVKSPRYIVKNEAMFKWIKKEASRYHLSNQGVVILVAKRCQLLIILDKPGTDSGDLTWELKMFTGKYYT